MSSVLTDSARFALAQKFTELAIQNNLIGQYDNSADTAAEVVTFYKTILNTIGKPSEEA
jgi:hypothetical protein